MQRSHSLLTISLFPLWALAEPMATVPWEEFRALYAEDVRRRLAKERSPDEAAGVIALERADLRLTMGRDRARGQLTVRGKHLAGETEPLPLVPLDLAVTGIVQAEGAFLARCDRHYCLHPEKPERFRVTLNLAFPLERGEHQRLLRLALSGAVSRSLALEKAGRNRPEGLGKRMKNGSAP